jgi:hypothetical protein
MKDTNKHVFISKIFASVFYIFFPILNETLYSHQLPYIYLVSIIPIVLYFFIKSIRTRKLKFTLISVLIASIFSSTYASLPVTGAFLIVTIPLLLYEFWNDKKGFIFHSIIWIVIFFGLNFYWLVHFFIQFLADTGAKNTTSLFSTGAVNVDNIRIINSTTRQYSPLSQIFITLKNFESKFVLNEVIRVIFLLIIIVAAFVGRKRDKSKIYPVLLICLLLSWFLFLPNFGEWGPKIFIKLTQTLPLFGMFRNMQDKFALPLAFFYALSFGMGLSIISKYISKTIIIKILYISISIILLLNLPRLINPLIPDREGLSRVSGVFNNDYMELIHYLKNIEGDERILWLPLNFPTYASIEDQNGNFYTGLSPVRILANKTDLNGRFSFMTPNDAFLGDKVLKWLEQGDYEKIGHLLKTLGVGHIVVQNQQPPNNIKPFYYGGKELPILVNQNNKFYSEILGEKIKDIGDRYEIYKINPLFQSSKIYLSQSDGVDYKKISSSKYEIKVNSIDSGDALILLEPFNSFWKLSVEGEEGIPPTNVVYDYANSWIVPEGGENINMILYFKPDRIITISYLISLFFLAMCFYIIFFKQKNERI